MAVFPSSSVSVADIKKLILCFRILQDFSRALSTHTSFSHFVTYLCNDQQPQGDKQ